MNALNEKQIQILQVAERLFAEKGFDGTSIRNISKEAGINIAMVSYYFGSKEKMLEALIFSRTSDLKIQLENILKEESEPMDKLNKLIELYLVRVDKNRCIYKIVHSESANVKRALSLKAFTDVKKRNLESLKMIIAQGQEKGIFRSDVNVALIPATIFGTYFQFHTGRELYEQIFDLKTDGDFENYIKNELAAHIKQTIKALLTHEIK